MMKVVVAKSYEITKWEEHRGSVYFYSEAGTLRICPQMGGIVRVSFTEEDTFSTEQGKDYEDFTGSLQYEVEETETSFCVLTKEGKVVVEKQSGAVSFLRLDDTCLLKERTYEPHLVEKIALYRTVDTGNLQVEEIATPDGVKKRIKAAERREYGSGYKTRTYFCLDDHETILGFGQGEQGEWNLRNSTYYGHQGNRKISIPLLVSSKNYGILLSTESLFLFREKEGEAFIQTEADLYLDYFFLFGENLHKVVKSFRKLTGKTAMLPAWAYGYIQSKERYESQEEILQVADEFCKRGVGVDTIVLDWMSWPDGQWGQKSFDPERFPDPQTMTEKLHEMGMHFMMSIWPNMSQGTKDNLEFKNAGLLLPGTDIYNAFNQEGRDLYWKQLRDSLVPAGVDAWWCDSSEPITPEWEYTLEPTAGEKYCDYRKNADNCMPLERANAFGKYHAQGIWENLKKYDATKRVVNLTRSGWAGSQKYGTILWSGDISASWECLRNQVRAGLQLAASGIPYWTMDTGAFFVKKGRNWFWDGQYPNGIQEDYKKLYVRWLEYAAFLPIFRAHGTDVDREPWAFGDVGNPYYEAICKTIQLRYSLLPYLYSVGAQVVLDDDTFTHPLLFDFDEDAKTAGISDQFMLGPCLMVCPFVTEKDTRTVYLPKGSGWYDFYTNAYFEGGQEILCECPLDRIPVFVKAGSLIPVKEPGRNVREMEAKPVQVVIYPGCDGTFPFYEDAEDGYGYEQGKYHISELCWCEKNQEFTVKSHGDKAYQKSKLNWKLVTNDLVAFDGEKK
ncbi:MAG: DUF4968 domain-containing protein [Lachnospiraceae bacterium]|nr:DUF4968 domain-containing protein [Lachnospiraceae bacterium]